MQVKASKRAFRYNNIPLVDPDPKMSVQQVREFYANIYPEITTAEIDGPENKGEQIVYTFRRAVGTKGARATVTIVYGAGIGKTRRRADLMKAFGAERIVDEWNGHSRLKAGDLAITNLMPPFNVPGANLVSATKAKAMVTE